MPEGLMLKFDLRKNTGYVLDVTRGKSAAAQVRVLVVCEQQYQPMATILWMDGQESSGLRSIQGGECWRRANLIRANRICCERTQTYTAGRAAVDARFWNYVWFAKLAP